MRKKKFRKITEKNIASIYGKILGLKKRWVDPTNFDNEYITPMMLSYGMNHLSRCEFNVRVSRYISVACWDVSLTKNTIVIDIKGFTLGMSSYVFRLTVGDKIALTGSTIKFKYDGTYYMINLSKRCKRLSPMPGDFDGDVMNVVKIHPELLYKEPIKTYDEKKPLGFGTSLLHSDMIKNLDLEKMYPKALATSARGSLEEVFYPNGQPKEIQITSIYGEFGGDTMSVFTEDDLPPLEDLLRGVAELEHHIGEQNRSMEFKIPKNWDSPRKEEE